MKETVIEQPEELAGFEKLVLQILESFSKMQQSMLQAAQEPKVVYNLQGASIQNSVINGNMTKSGPETNYYGETKEKKSEVDEEHLVSAIEKCMYIFWGNTCYAVLYCVLRDEYNMQMTMSQFERMVENLPYHIRRKFFCPEGTLSSTFASNQYMKLHIDKWIMNGAKERVLKLVEQFKQALNEPKNEECEALEIE